MIAMEFTSKYVHMLEGGGGKKNVAVKRSVSVQVPERSIRNGYIRNEEELSGALLEALVDHDFRSKDVSLTIDSTAIKVKAADIPYVSRERALQFVKREFGNVISDEEHLFDYIIHRTYKKGRQQQMKCTIYAVPRELLLNYSLLCKTMGLKLKRIDVLNDVVTKQIEMEYPKIRKEIKEKVEPEGIDGPVRMWVGFYYEKLKLITNGIRGDLFIKTIMLEGLERREDSEENEEKELIALCVNEIRKFINFQEKVSPDYPIEQIELFGEHVMLQQLCSVIGSFARKSTILLTRPRMIKGISDQEYAKYVGVIGNLVRR